MKILHHLKKGFTIVGVLIALTVLAAMSASIIVLVATNQSTRTQQLHTDQAFYSANAALEYAMRQVLVDGNPNPIPLRYFMKKPFNITRACNKISVTATAGGASNTFSIGDAAQLCTIEGGASPNSNSAPFNGQSIAQGQYIWFNANLTPADLDEDIITHIYLESSNVLFTASGVNYNIVIPGAILTFDPTATCVSTSYVLGQWHTTVPTDQRGNIFVSGVGFLVPVNLPGSISPVTWTGVFASDQPGVSVHWDWGAAVYTTSLADLPGLNVKASDRDTCGNDSNDKSGTPTNVKAYLTNGARSGGGSNYTGGGSGTSGTVVQCISDC